MTTEIPTPRRKQYSSTKAKLPKTPMTLEQLRSYLKGIQFVGGEGWHPDQKQWEAIVHLIDTLVPDQVPQVEAESSAPYSGYGTVPYPIPSQNSWAESAQIPRIQDIPGGGFTTTPPVTSTPVDGAPYRTEFL